MALIYDEKEGWRVATPKIIGHKRGIEIGTSFDGWEGANDNPTYQKTAATYFGLITTGGQIMPFIIEKSDKDWEGAKIARNVANRYNTILGLFPGFYPSYETDEIKKASPKEIEEYVNSRIARLISLINKSDKDHSLTYLFFVNEAFYGWQGRYDWYRNENPFYRVWGENWIAKIYSITYEKAKDKGLTPGKDFIMIYNDGELSYPGKKLTLVHNELLETKRKIAKELGISLEEVQLDVGIQLHITPNPNNDGNYFKIPSESELSQAIKILSDIGKVHITEADVRDVTKEEGINILKDLLQTAALTGQVRSFTFYNTFRFIPYYPNGPFEHGPNGLFDKFFHPTHLYYSLISSLLSLP